MRFLRAVTFSPRGRSGAHSGRGSASRTPSPRRRASHRERDVARPRRIWCGPEKLGGVGSVIVELGGEIVRFGGVASANGADSSGSSQSEVSHLHHPINAATSMRVDVIGATPIAIASAIMPSMRPLERFFDNLRFEASRLPSPRWQRTCSGPGARRAGACGRG